MKVIRQRDERDCGVCSLAYIINYYKGFIPLEVIRLDAKTDNNGTSALNLILASHGYGLDGEGVKYDDVTLVKRLPAIAHLNLKNGLNHFVVITKITKDKITLMNPAKGKEVLSLKEFKEIFSGVILEFYPKRKLTILKNEITIYSLFKKVLIVEKKLITTLFVVGFISVLFTIIGSYYFQISSSVINGMFSIKYLKIIFILFGGFLILKILLMNMKLNIENYLKKNIDCMMGSDFINHLFNIPMNAITSRKSGEILTRVEELKMVKDIIIDIYLTFTIDLLLMLISVPFLLSISWKLFLILLIFLILYLIISLLTIKKSYEVAFKNISLESEYKNIILEDIKRINSINNLNITNKVLKRIEVSLCNYLYDTFKLNKYLSKIKVIKYSINEFCLYGVLSYGFYLIYNSKLDIISLVTFNTILAFFLDPLEKLLDSLPKLSYLKATIIKLNDFLSIKPLRKLKVSNIDNWNIKIENLSYSYNKYKYIINNLNLEIKKGEFVLLSGQSGSGKSTLCNILDKYILDYEGSVFIGDINIKDLGIETIRNNILYVNQYENIKTGTIEENIIENRDISDKEFNSIVDVCNILPILDNKPMRYNTLINNDEHSLSGGEKQRIILARALVNNFNILILDEALSEIDKDMELNILKKIRNKYKDKTIIYISHKKYSKKVFDKEICLT